MNAMETNIKAQTVKQQVDLDALRAKFKTALAEGKVIHDEAMASQRIAAHKAVEEQARKELEERAAIEAEALEYVTNTLPDLLKQTRAKGNKVAKVYKTQRNSNRVNNQEQRIREDKLHNCIANLCSKLGLKVYTNSLDEHTDNNGEFPVHDTVFYTSVFLPA